MMRIVIVNDFSIYIYTLYISDFFFFFFFNLLDYTIFIIEKDKERSDNKKHACSYY